MPVEVDYSSEFRYRRPSDRRRAHAGGRDHAVGRDGGHARRAARGEAARRAEHRDLQRRRQHGDARGRRHGLHARRTRRSASRRRRRSRRSSSRCTCSRSRSARRAGRLSPDAARPLLTQLEQLPLRIEEALQLDRRSKRSRARCHHHRDFLYLGRGINYPIALEGALKLKEISYIHAEGYPAGEMKHGPIALIDEDLPVVALAADDGVFEKALGNIQEAKARGGRVIVVTNASKVAALRRDPRPSARRRPRRARRAPAADAGAARGAAAAARVPRRDPARLRRRSAEESREERDGGVAVTITTGDRVTPCTRTCRSVVSTGGGDVVPCRSP